MKNYFGLLIYDDIRIEKANILYERRQKALLCVCCVVLKKKSPQRVLCDEIFVLITEVANRGVL